VFKLKIHISLKSYVIGKRKKKLYIQKHHVNTGGLNTSE